MPAEQQHINVAVSGLNATDNPGPGVAVIRSIRESNEFKGSITGLSYDPLDPGIYMAGICDSAFMMPVPSEGAENLLTRIKEIHAITPIDVILPCLDAELFAYIKISRQLADMGIRTFLPDDQGLKLRAKDQFDRLADFGINVPRSKSIRDVKAVFELEDDMSFPVMVKGQFYEAHLARSPMEVDYFFRKLNEKWGLPIIVQEFIVGEEYDIVALGDGNGGLVGSVPMKKMQLTGQGKAWGGITINDDDMNTCIQDIIAKLKWRGPCEIELIKSKDQGTFFLMEFNPRFPAWCYLAVGAGQNLPWAAVKLALDKPVEAFSTHEIGIMFLRNSVDQIYSLSEYQKMITDGEIIRRAPHDP
jgi:carbamoyl-phosphate synthase large subunit